MELYGYDNDTKEYTGTFQARLDPRATEREGRNVYAIPSNSTIIEPSDIKEGFVKCFIDGEWVDVENNRGKIIYNIDTKSENVFAELGPIPKEYTLLTPFEDCRWNGTQWVTDLTAVAAREARQAKIDARLADILVAFPSWGQMKLDIEEAFPDPKQQKVIRRIAKVVNWLAKDSNN